MKLLTIAMIVVMGLVFALGSGSAASAAKAPKPTPTPVPTPAWHGFPNPCPNGCSPLPFPQR